ncbi:glycerate-2-kinase [Rhizobium tibeticum]|nr:glycerate-2-kinase [Rhizobium tibeticum]
MTATSLCVSIPQPWRVGYKHAAAETDGIGGSEDNAGAFADGQTIARLRQLRMDAV